MRRACVAIGLMMLLGCGGGAKVSNESKSDPAGEMPSMIYVENFDLGAATIQQDPGTITGRPRLINFHKDPAQQLQELADLLEKSLVEELHKAKMPAKRLADGAKRPASGWLVSGQLMEVIEGNRMQKAVVGFGMGNSQAELYVTVKEAAKPDGKDLLDFNVTSDGTKGPGGGVGTVVTHMPYAMAAKFLLNRDAADADIKRAAREISEELVKLSSTPPGKMGVDAK